MTTNTTITPELLDQLLANYKKPEDLTGDDGLFKQLKKALLEAYHGRAENPSDPAVLLKLVSQVGLDVQRAKEILDSEEFALQVRESEQFYQQAGIHSVPAVIINDKHLISGGQPVELFEQALRKIAAS